MRNEQHHHFGGDVLQFVVENVSLHDVKKYLIEVGEDTIFRKRQKKIKPRCIPATITYVDITSFVEGMEDWTEQQI
jgi:hypothetical protein